MPWNDLKNWIHIIMRTFGNYEVLLDFFEHGLLLWNFFNCSCHSCSVNVILFQKWFFSFEVWKDLLEFTNFCVLTMYAINNSLKLFVINAFVVRTNVTAKSRSFSSRYVRTKRKRRKCLFNEKETSWGQGHIMWYGQVDEKKCQHPPKIHLYKIVLR